MPDFHQHPHILSDLLRSQLFRSQFLRNGEREVAEKHYRAALLEGWRLVGWLDLADGRLAEAETAFGRASPNPEAEAAVLNAEMVIIGPGSLYTSLITNLLVRDIPAALARAKGVRVYICNLMTQANESLGLRASQHIECIYKHTRAPIFDYALVNTATFSPETLARYAAAGASPIEADIERIEALGVHCITGNFASEDTLVRHDAARVTAALLRLGDAAIAGR